MANNVLDIQIVAHDAPDRVVRDHLDLEINRGQGLGHGVAFAIEHPPLVDVLAGLRYHRIETLQPDGAVFGRDDVAYRGQVRWSIGRLEFRSPGCSPAGILDPGSNHRVEALRHERNGFVGHRRGEDGVSVEVDFAYSYDGVTVPGPHPSLADEQAALAEARQVRVAEGQGEGRASEDIAPFPALRPDQAQPAALPIHAHIGRFRQLTTCDGSRHRGREAQERAVAQRGDGPQERIAPTARVRPGRCRSQESPRQVEIACAVGEDVPDPQRIAMEPQLVGVLELTGPLTPSAQHTGWRTIRCPSSDLTLSRVCRIQQSIRTEGHVGDRTEYVFRVVDRPDCRLAVGQGPWGGGEGVGR